MPMSDEQKDALWDALMVNPSDEADFEVERETLQLDRSFSQEALEDLHQNIIMFIGSRVLRSWNEKNQPPTYLKVEMKVIVG